MVMNEKGISRSQHSSELSYKMEDIVIFWGIFQLPQSILLSWDFLRLFYSRIGLILKDEQSFLGIVTCFCGVKTNSLSR